MNAGAFTLTEPIVSTSKQSAIECARYCLQKKCLSFTYGGNEPNETKLCEIFMEPLMLDHNGPKHRPGAKHMKMVGEVKQFSIDANLTLLIFENTTITVKVFLLIIRTLAKLGDL